MLLSLFTCKPGESREPDLRSIMEQFNQRTSSRTGGGGLPEPERLGDGSWTVLVYLSGSDLESQAGHASMDILEMFDSPDVQLVIQTGGGEKTRKPKSRYRLF